MLINTGQCGAGVPTGETPESVEQAVAVQSSNIALQQAVSNAQAAANSIYARTPWDYADMGVNIFNDVANSNARGAGGPASRIAPFGYSAPGVPFGPTASTGELDVKQCGVRAPSVQIVPLATSLSKVRQPTLTTTQPVAVPPVVQAPAPAPATAAPVAACQRPGRTGNICLDLYKGAVLQSEVSAAVLYACSQKGYAGTPATPCVTPGPQIQVSDAELAAVPPLSSLGLSGYRARGMGAAYPVGGAYPVSCTPASNATPSTDSSFPWGWAILLGVAALAFAGTGGRRH